MTGADVSTDVEQATRDLAVAIVRSHRNGRNAELFDSASPVSDDLILEMSRQIAAAIAPVIHRAVTSDSIEPNVAEASQPSVTQPAVVQSMARAGYRSVLYALALDNHGFVTTDMAKSAGVPAVEVRKLASRGGMTNVARGVYRVDGIDGGAQAPYAEAVFRVGTGSFLCGESVLALHNLAQVNPTAITVATARRVRRDLPSFIQVIPRRLSSGEVTEYDNIPSMTVSVAIREAIGSVRPGLLMDAVELAVENGLLRRRDARLLTNEIENVE